MFYIIGMSSVTTCINVVYNIGSAWHMHTCRTWLCYIVVSLSLSLPPFLSLCNELTSYFCMQLVSRLTKDIVETFQLCNINFKYSDVLNPKRFLTNPSVGVLNDGHDNANSDLILHANTVLVNSTTNQRFVLIMDSRFSVWRTFHIILSFFVILCK